MSRSPDGPGDSAADLSAASPGLALPSDLAAAFARLELMLGATDSPTTNPARLGVKAARLSPVPGAAAASTSFAWRAHEQFPAASTIKVYVLQALMERVAAGEMSLDSELSVNAVDMVTGSGVLKALTPGRRYPLLDLATLMIVVSDNTATNVLIDALGVEQVNDSVLEHGWRATHLSGKLQVSAAERGSRPAPSLTSPADLLDYFARLWAGELLPPDLTEACQRIYRQQQYSELGRALGHDPYSVEVGVAPWRIASKSGSLRGVRNDAGVFETVDGGPELVVAVMTKGCPDERFHAENLGARVVGLAAAEVHARLMG